MSDFQGVLLVALLTGELCFSFICIIGTIKWLAVNSYFFYYNFIVFYKGCKNISNRFNMKNTLQNLCYIAINEIID